MTLLIRRLSIKLGCHVGGSPIPTVLRIDTPVVISNMVHTATHPKDAPKNFDFIVLGGGAGGCTVAGRLAENPNVSVLLVEAGVQ